MRLPTSDTTAIHRLRLRHRAAEGDAEPGRRIEAVRRAIEWADWPRAPAESWVFVRRLEAAASADQLARSLASAARAELQHAGSDNVVRFADLAELLASLLSDLVAGQAAARWYWRRWSHLFALPAPRAAAELMMEHLPHLATICARLSRAGALNQVWAALGQSEARGIAEALARHGGFVLPDAEALDAERALPTQPSDAPRFPIPATVRNRWSPLLHRLPPRDWRSVAALTLVAMEVAPLQLQTTPARLLARLGDALQPRPARPPARSRPRDAGADDPPRTSRRAPAVAEGIASPGTLSSETADRIGASASPPVTAPAALPTVASNRAEPSAGPDAPARCAQATLDPPTEDANARQPRPLHPPPRSHTPPIGTMEAHFAAPMPVETAPFTGFVTGQGGLLYLLNLLDRDEAREVMERHADELPSGWSWLYRLGQELELNEADPITSFLAEQMGLEVRELAALPPMPPPARSRLRSLAARWYGRFDVWHPELLRLEARIQATPSHVELHASLNAVRLPVRLAGLDVNPGWLPWLNRVVSFHYE